MTGLPQPSAALQAFVHRQGLAEPGTLLRWTGGTQRP